jgi:cysteinyl-tRNA synthetase
MTVFAERKQLYIYNSKTRQKELFRPVQQQQQQPEQSSSNNDNNVVVTMYTCGPTVYDAAHIGNFRAFLTYDVMKRVLMYLGYRILHVCNITDVDDKIIQRANEQQIAIGNIHTQLTQIYETKFRNDLIALNCIPASVYPHATEHIPVMIRFVQELIRKNLAYEVDGSWYFDTQQYQPYGTQLVQLDFQEMEAQKETFVEADKKRHFADFCLWKAYKEGNDRPDMAWQSQDFVGQETLSASSSTNDPSTNIMNGSGNDKEEAAYFEMLRQSQPYPLSEPIIGKGRPGWHLECSAMAKTYFGEQTIDLHGGGMDLKFPHHENEIAQSEGLHDRNTFCNCWFHNGFVEVGENTKMSKSLGNFLTLDTACPTAADVRAYRYLVVTSQYRNPLRFTDTILQASKKAVARIDKVVAKLDEILESHEPLVNNVGVDYDSVYSVTSETNHLALVQVSRALDSFETAICDDLSMPRAAAALFDLIKLAEATVFPKKSTAHDKPKTKYDLVVLRAIRNGIAQMDQVFGILYTIPSSIRKSNEEQASKDSKSIPPEVLELVNQRTAAKNSKDWETADSLRRRITELGYAVQDVKNGEPIVTPGAVES